MLLVLGNGETGVFDVRLDFPRVDLSQARLAESLTNEELRPGHVIGGQRGIGRAIRYGRQIALGIADIMSVAVAAAYSAYVTDVVTEKGYRKVQPVARCDTALTGVFAAQNLLADQRHHDGMIHVVVGSIAVGNVFQCQPSDEGDDAGVAGFQHPVDATIHLLKLLNKGLDDDLRGIEHRGLRTAK